MSSTRQGLAYNLVYQVINISMPLVTAPYISRVLGPTGIGTYSYMYSVAAYFVYFILLGINNHGVRTIAKCVDREEQITAFWNLYAIQFTNSIIVIVVYLGYCLVLQSGDRIALILLIYVLSGTLDINWFFFGTENFKTAAYRNAIVKISLTVLIFIFVKKAEDLPIYACLMASSYLMSQMIMWVTFFRRYHFVRPQWKCAVQNIKPLLILFVPVIAVSLYKTMDKIMLGALATMEQVGFYENAEKIVAVPSVITVALGTVMMPKMSRLLANHDSEGIEKYLYKSIDVVCMLSSAMAFGILSVSNIFVEIYYGPEFLPSAQVMRVLSITLLFTPWASVIRTQYLIPHEKDNVYVLSVFFGALVNLVLNALLIPRFEANGAAIATVFAEASVACYHAFAIRHETKIIAVLINNLKWLLPGLIMMFVLKKTILTLEVGLVIKLCATVLSGMVIYLALAVAMTKIEKENRER